jgi:hypothetical protein
MSRTIAADAGYRVTLRVGRLRIVKDCACMEEEDMADGGGGR